MLPAVTLKQDPEACSLSVDRSNRVLMIYLFHTAKFVHGALVAVHTVLSQVEVG